MMKKSILILIVMVCYTGLVAMGQNSAAFNKIDSTHSYMDVVFGSQLNNITGKMGLKKMPYNTANQYTITNATYLKIGNYTATTAIAFFSKDNLYCVRLLIEAWNKQTAYEEVLKYFRKWWGKPESAEGGYVWYGRTMIISIKPVRGHTLIDVQSRIISFPETDKQ